MGTDMKNPTVEEIQAVIDRVKAYGPWPGDLEIMRRVIVRDLELAIGVDNSVSLEQFILDNGFQELLEEAP